MLKRRLLGLMATALPGLALIPAASCLSNEQPAAPANAIRIGTVLPFSGEGAASGVPLEAALRLAIQQINSAGGVGGRELFLDVRDSQSDVQRGTANALALIDSGQIPFFVGPEEPEIATKITTSIKTQHVTDMMPGLTSPLFTDPSTQGAWSRLVPSLNYLACGLAKRVIRDQVGKTAVVVDPDDCSTTFATIFGRVLTDNAGGTLLPLVRISRDASSYADALAMLDSQAPDGIVLLASPTVAAGFLQQWAVRSKRGKWYLGPTLNNPELLRNVPDGVLEGMHGVSPDLGPTAGAFVEFFRAHTGMTPIAGSHYYFDAVALLGLAIADGLARDGAVPPPATIKQNLARVTAAPGELVSFDDIGHGLQLLQGGGDVQYNGAAGTYVLDSHGDSMQNRVAIWEIQGKEFANVDYEQCAQIEVYTKY